MSGSETGTVMTSPFNNVAGHNSPSSQHMRLSYEGAAIYKPLPNPPAVQYQNPTEPAGSAPPISVVQPPPQQQHQNMNVMGEVVKKKRGRPRKYGPDGSMGLLTLTSPPDAASGGPLSSPVLQSSPLQNLVGSASGSSPKKGRGRPPGSKKKHRLNIALGMFLLLSSLVCVLM